MVKRLKVEFLIPLKYNDGTDVEPEKLFMVKEKVVELFGGITIHPFFTEGIWIDPKTHIEYYDKCRRFEVSVEKSPEIYKTLTKLKDDLKKTFKQEEIYMYYTEITQI